MIEAKGIASSQIGVGSDAETRDSQARVIDAMLAEVMNTANRKYQQLYFFGGNAFFRASSTDRNSFTTFSPCGSLQRGSINCEFQAS